MELGVELELGNFLNFSKLTLILSIQGVPKKNPIAPPKNGLQAKVGRVLENSGNFQSNEHNNIPILGKKWLRKWRSKLPTPPLKNYISEQHTVDFLPSHVPQ